jgi:hypothetical protein
MPAAALASRLEDVLECVRRALAKGEEALPWAEALQSATKNEKTAELLYLVSGMINWCASAHRIADECYQQAKRAAEIGALTAWPAASDETD